MLFLSPAVSRVSRFARSEVSFSTAPQTGIPVGAGLAPTTLLGVAVFLTSAFLPLRSLPVLPLGRALVGGADRHLPWCCRGWSGRCVFQTLLQRGPGCRMDPAVRAPPERWTAEGTHGHSQVGKFLNPAVPAMVSEAAGPLLPWPVGSAVCHHSGYRPRGPAQTHRAASQGWIRPWWCPASSTFPSKTPGVVSVRSPSLPLAITHCFHF